MQSQIKLTSAFPSKKGEYLVDRKPINSLKLQNYIKIKFNLDELSNFHDFLVGKSDLKIGYRSGAWYTNSTIDTTPSIKKNIDNFNFYIRRG